MITVPPVLADLPSCVLYLRAGPTGSGIKDWGPSRRSITNSSVANATTITPKFPPAELYFNGSAYCLTPAINNMTPLNGYSYIVSVTFNTTGSVKSIIGTRTGDTSSNINWSLYEDDGNLITFDAFNTSNSRWNGTSPISTSTAFSSGTWNNVILAISSANAITIYLNGNSVASGTGSGQIRGRGLALTVGKFGSSVLPSFTGGLDEIAIWDSSLGGPTPTVAQIWAVAQQRRMIA